MSIRVVILTAFVVATALLALRLHRIEQRMGESRAQIAQMLERRSDDIEIIEQRLLRSRILQTYANECFEHADDTLNRVEREPCRFVCATPTAELWESELDEAICGDLK